MKSHTIYMDILNVFKYIHFEKWGKVPHRILEHCKTQKWGYFYYGEKPVYAHMNYTWNSRQ